MSLPAPSAAISTSPTTRAGTGIAPSARAARHRTGCRRAWRTCCRWNTSTWSSPCRAPVTDIAYQNKAAVYGLLFTASARTLLAIAADPKHLGARTGMTSVLHTWGSAMTHHPHVHVVVPGGGLSPDGTRWIACRQGFFLPVKVLSRLFRRLFLEGLARLHQAGKLRFFGDLSELADPDTFQALLAPLRKSDWVVYAKPPFGGPEAVLAYLSRYTHRVAISNHRLDQRRCRHRGLPLEKTTGSGRAIA